jgi:hypothetical protein
MPSEGEPIVYFSPLPFCYTYAKDYSIALIIAACLSLYAMGGFLYGLRLKAIQLQTSVSSTFGALPSADDPSVEDPLCCLGAFEPTEARRLLPLLEKHHINFRIEADNSALARPNRFLWAYFGVYPDGSKIIVYVPEDQLSEVMEITKTLFPV